MAWAHVDLAAKLWTIPKTKNGAEHRVPLSDAAVLILERCAAERDGAGTYVFPGRDPGRPLVASSLRRELAALDYAGRASVHGFRASFSTWVADENTFSSDTAYSPSPRSARARSRSQ